MTEPASDDALDRHHIPPSVDWIVGVLVVLAGLATLLAGTVLRLWVDRDLLAAAVADGAIHAPAIADAELVDVAHATVAWTSTGLLVTGGGLLVAGLGYVLYRRRARGHTATDADAPAGASRGDYVAHAVVGAVVSAVLAFVPFSTTVGGGVAGYLERGHSGRVVSVGTLSGVLAVAPVVLFGLFVCVGLALATARTGRTGLAVVIGIASVLGLATAATIGVATGAIGGYVGGALAERERDS